MVDWSKTIAKNSTWLLLPLFAFPILPSALQSISLILVSLLLIFAFYRDFTQNFSRIGLIPFIMAITWVIVMGLTLIYSTEKTKGSDYLIRSISLVLIPFLFFYFLPKLNDKHQKIISIFFVSLYVFISIFIFFKIVDGVDAIGYINENGQRIKGIKQQPWIDQLGVILKMPPHLSRYYLNENEVKEIFIHKAYISMGYVWCVFLILFGFKRELSKRVKIISVLVVSLFIFMVFYFTSMPNILILLLFLFGFLIYRFLKLKRRDKLTIVILSSLLLVLSYPKLQHYIFKNDRLISGKEEVKGMLFSFFSENKTQEVNVRSVVWACAIDAIYEKPLFGYGIGVEGELLKKCYKRKNCSECAIYSFNAHNQFLSMAINGGALLLISYIVSLLYFFWLAYLKKDAVYLFFLILFLANIIGESMLVRIHGILFFTFFNSLFLSIRIKD